jgi:hypothetical protein
MEAQIEMMFPGARKSDPLTSHMAAAEVHIRAGSQQWKLLEAFAKHPLRGLTDEEAGIETKLDQIKRCCYWKRCSELRQAGLIRASETETRLSTANKEQQVSYITEAGKRQLEVLSGEWEEVQKTEGGRQEVEL